MKRIGQPLSRPTSLVVTTNTASTNLLNGGVIGPEQDQEVYAAILEGLLLDGVYHLCKKANHQVILLFLDDCNYY